MIYNILICKRFSGVKCHGSVETVVSSCRQIGRNDSRTLGDRDLLASIIDSDKNDARWTLISPREPQITKDQHAEIAQDVLFAGRLHKRHELMRHATMRKITFVAANLRRLGATKAKEERSSKRQFAGWPWFPSVAPCACSSIHSPPSHPSLRPLFFFFLISSTCKYCLFARALVTHLRADFLQRRSILLDNYVAKSDRHSGTDCRRPARGREFEGENSRQERIISGHQPSVCSPCALLFD